MITPKGLLFIYNFIDSRSSIFSDLVYEFIKNLYTPCIAKYCPRGTNNECAV